MRGRDVGYEERNCAGVAGGEGEAATFDRGEMLADAVDFDDGCAAMNEGLMEGNGVRE